MPRPGSPPHGSPPPWRPRSQRSPGAGRQGGRTSASRGVPARAAASHAWTEICVAKGWVASISSPIRFVPQVGRPDPPPRRSRRHGPRRLAGLRLASAARQRRNHRKRGERKRASTASARARPSAVPPRIRSRDSRSEAGAANDHARAVDDEHVHLWAGAGHRPARHSATARASAATVSARGSPASLATCRIAAAVAALRCLGQRRVGRAEGGEAADQAVAVDTAALRNEGPCGRRRAC